MKQIFIFSLLFCVAHLNMVKSGKTVLGKNGKFYYISHPLKENWWQADRFCTYHKMHLVDIFNEEDEDAIQEIIQATEYRGLGEPFFWIGATDQGSEGCFYWINSGLPVIYSNFTAGQPDNAGGEHCAEIRGHFKYYWNDHQCSEKKYFICDNTVRSLENPTFDLKSKNTIAFPVTEQSQN